MNVFEASVKLYLVDKVSAGLGAVARSMAKTETAATALNAKMATIGANFRSGLMLGAAGGALALPLVAAAKAANEYEHQINRMNAAGMTHKEVADSIGASWATTNKIITSGVTDNLKIISDMRTIFGNTPEAIKYMPIFAEVQGAYASVLDGKLAGRKDELSFAAAKAADMLGKVNNRKEFNDAITDMFKVTVATQGRITPSDYQSTFKFARQAKFSMDDTFLYKKLPELMLENVGKSGGATGVGSQLATLYGVGVLGRMTKQAAVQFEQLGMLHAKDVLKTKTTLTTVKGGLLGAGLLAKDPDSWVNSVLVPRLEKIYHIKSTNTDALITASNKLFMSNRLAANLVAELIKKHGQYQRFGILYDKADSPAQALKRGLANDPMTNWEAFDKSIDNLKIAFGDVIVPAVLPYINKLASSLQRMAKYMHDHRGITQMVTGIAAVASVALIAAGSLKILGAGFELFKVFGGLIPWVARVGTLLPLLGAGIAAAAAALAPFAVIIGAVTIAVVGAYLVYKNWGSIVKAATPYVDMLGKAIRNMAASIAWAMGKIAGLIALTPGLADMGTKLQSAANGMARAAAATNDVSKSPAGKHLALAGSGAGGGNVIPIAGIRQSPTTVNYAPVFNLHMTPGMDIQAVSNLIDKKNRKAQIDLVKSLQHSTYGGGLNSVGLSGNAKGNHS